MARTSTIWSGLAATLLAIGGCATQQTAVSDQNGLALGTVGGATPDHETYHLGAGDALGQEIFTYYVACLRASEEYYATGENDFPADN